MGKNNFIKRVIKNFVVDMLYDETTGRGGEYDASGRLKGNPGVSRGRDEYRRLYESNGLITSIISRPAKDATREWIEIETNLDKEFKINEMIKRRIDELGLQLKIKELIKNSRMYQKGSMLYYGFIGDTITSQLDLTGEIKPEQVQQIDFINLIDNPDVFTIEIMNRIDPTKKDFNVPTFRLYGSPVHESRLSWLCNDFNPQNMRGVSVIDTIFDPISAEDSSLWSIAQMVLDLSTKVYTSSNVERATKEIITALLLKLKNDMTTASSVAMKPGETYEKLVHNLPTGLSDVFEFIFDVLGGSAEMPRNVLLGKAFGVVTAGEYDTLGYYSNIASYQELEIRPIIKKNIDFITWEKRGEIYKTLGERVNELVVTFKFKPLWKLDPVSQADTELKNAQRDTDDIESGKISSEEARSLDPRLSTLESFRQRAVTVPAVVGQIKTSGLDI